MCLFPSGELVQDEPEWFFAWYRVKIRLSSILSIEVGLRQSVAERGLLAGLATLMVYLTQPEMTPHQIPKLF
jgi:hypothetical protein